MVEGRADDLSFRGELRWGNLWRARETTCDKYRGARGVVLGRARSLLAGSGVLQGAPASLARHPRSCNASCARSLAQHRVVSRASAISVDRYHGTTIADGARALRRQKPEGSGIVSEIVPSPSPLSRSSICVSLAWPDSPNLFRARRHIDRTPFRYPRSPPGLT